GELYSPLPLPCKAHMTSKECQRYASIAPLHWKLLTRPLLYLSLFFKQHRSAAHIPSPASTPRARKSRNREFPPRVHEREQTQNTSPWLSATPGPCSSLCRLSAKRPPSR